MAAGSLDMLRQVLAQIHGSLDLTRTLDAIARGVVAGTSFQVAAVTMVLPSGDYQVVAVEGDDEARAQLLGSVEPATTWERLYAMSIELGRLLFVDHTRGAFDESMASWVPTVTPSDDPDAWHPEDVLFAPLVDSTGRRVGALSVDLPRDGRRPTSLAVEELELYAMQAALAIEHAHSHAAAQQNAALRERERMAEDMHDFVTQGLFAVSLDLGRALQAEDRSTTEHLIERALQGVDEATQHLRASIRGAAATPDADHIGATLSAITSRAAASLGFDPTVRWVGEVSVIPPDIARELIAVLTEALSNIVKHAHASAVAIAVTVTDSAVTLSVRDNGIGLGDAAGRGNSGLDTMRRRAERHHGTCSLTSDPQHGTTIIWTVPRT